MRPPHSDLWRIVGRYPDLTFRQVNVFCTGPRTGNPAMVVFGGDELSTAEMQDIARDVNLSETVFLLPGSEGADYKARIFTVRREIPFAGHPALAAAHAFAELARPDALELIQEDGLGRTFIRRAALGADWNVDLPLPRAERPALRAAAEIAAMLGIEPAAVTRRPPAIVATGVRWILVELRSADILSRLRPDYDAIATWSRDSNAVGLVPFALSTESGIDVELRSFAPAEGIYEDPVCGSCAGSLAALLAHGAARTYVFAQDDLADRPGRMQVRITPSQAPILSGKTQTVLPGSEPHTL